MRKCLFTLILFLAALFVPITASAQSQPSAPVFAGEAVGTDGTVYEVQATLRQVGLESNELVASVVDYSITDTVTGETVSDSFASPLALDAGSGCSILFLDVQPIFLDLLGLQLETSEIVIDLSAVAGQGQLLGNLLCIVTGLLDGPGIFIQLVNNFIALINNILAGLG